MSSNVPILSRIWKAKKRKKLVFIMLSPLSCEYPQLFNPPFGSYFGESDCLLLIWGACSHGHWTLCCRPWQVSAAGCEIISGYKFTVLSGIQTAGAESCLLWRERSTPKPPRPVEEMSFVKAIWMQNDLIYFKEQKRKWEICFGVFEATCLLEKL